MVVAEPQHHEDWVVLLGRFQMAMGLMCLWRESQHVVSSDSHPLAELCLDCKRKVVDHSRLYRSCQEPVVELEEEVDLPSSRNLASFQT